MYGCARGGDGGLDAVAEVGMIDLSEVPSVFGRERPLSVALTVIFQADYMCTS